MLRARKLDMEIPPDTLEAVGVDVLLDISVLLLVLSVSKVDILDVLLDILKLIS